jgi:hypothetical protein
MWTNFVYSSEDGSEVHWQPVVDGTDEGNYHNGDWDLASSTASRTTAELLNGDDHAHPRRSKTRQNAGADESPRSSIRLSSTSSVIGIDASQAFPKMAVSKSCDSSASVDSGTPPQPLSNASPKNEIMTSRRLTPSESALRRADFDTTSFHIDVDEDVGTQKWDDDDVGSEEPHPAPLRGALPSIRFSQVEYAHPSVIDDDFDDEDIDADPSLCRE